VRLDAAEGDVAVPLAALQLAHPEIQMGSYPFFERDKLGTYVVLRGADEKSLASALAALWELIAQEGFSASAANDD